MNKAIFLSVSLILISAANAQALQCFSLLDDPLFVEATEEEKKLIRLNALTALIASSSNENLVVFGQFSKTSDLPFTHTVDHNKRWVESDSGAGNSQIYPGLTEYTYFDAIEFRGMKIINGRVEKFHTDKTYFTIELDGEWIGQLPNFKNRTIGTISVNKEDKDRYDIPTGFCPSFFPISEKELQEALDCVNKKSTCPISVD